MRANLNINHVINIPSFIFLSRFFNLGVTPLFLSQILILILTRRARANPKPAVLMPITMTPTLKMMRITKQTTNLPAVEAHLPGKSVEGIFFCSSHHVFQ